MSQKKKISDNHLILLVGSASLIYFCGERMIRDISDEKIEDLLGSVAKVRNACTKMERIIGAIELARDQKKL